MGLDKISKIIVNLIYSNPEDKINNLFLFIVALKKNKFKMFCQYFDSHKYSKPIYLQLNLKAQDEKKITIFIQTEVSVLFLKLIWNKHKK